MALIFSGLTIGKYIQKFGIFAQFDHSSAKNVDVLAIFHVLYDDLTTNNIRFTSSTAKNH